MYHSYSTRNPVSLLSQLHTHNSYHEPSLKSNNPETSNDIIPVSIHREPLVTGKHKISPGSSLRPPTKGHDVPDDRKFPRSLGSQTQSSFQGPLPKTEGRTRQVSTQDRRELFYWTTFLPPSPLVRRTDGRTPVWTSTLPAFEPDFGLRFDFRFGRPPVSRSVLCHPSGCDVSFPQERDPGCRDQGVRSPGDSRPATTCLSHRGGVRYHARAK